MTNEKVKFTVVIPTSIDRGLLLPYSVGSILKQTVQDFEIFIIGDGVNDYTRQVIQELQKEDNRIHFFDFPKHPRRGEENRHQVLSQAKGTYVTYLCDRDLMLPHHLATLEIYLKDSDFASTLNFNVIGEGLLFGFKNLEKPKPASWVLSCVGHTLAFYNELPYGWRTTPQNQYTDVYMWDQFLDHPSCRSYAGMEPTILWFKRGDHPGLSTVERKVELEKWSLIIHNPQLLTKKKENSFYKVLKDHEFVKKNYSFLFKGKRLNQIPSEIGKKIKKILFQK